MRNRINRTSAAKKLVWTSTATSLGATTFAFDCSDCDALMVDFGNSVMEIVPVIVNNSGRYFTIGTTPYNNYRFRRAWFDSSYKFNVSEGFYGTTVDNTNAVPLNIWKVSGLKTLFS